MIRMDSISGRSNEGVPMGFLDIRSHIVVTVPHHWHIQVQTPQLGVSDLVFANGTPSGSHTVEGAP